MATLVAKNHPALHTIAEEITEAEFTDGTVEKLIKDLRKALRTYSVDGFVPVAIAAPQIGVSKRIFLIDGQSNSKDCEQLPFLVAINPQLIKRSKKTHLVEEGCLSLPELYGSVQRSTNVTLAALDETATPYQRGAGGLLAQIIQHEYDHLDGILFTDRAEEVWQIVAQ